MILLHAGRMWIVNMCGDSNDFNYSIKYFCDTKRDQIKNPTVAGALLSVGWHSDGSQTAGLPALFAYLPADTQSFRNGIKFIVSPGLKVELKLHLMFQVNGNLNASGDS